MNGYLRSLAARAVDDARVAHPLLTPLFGEPVPSAVTSGLAASIGPGSSSSLLASPSLSSSLAAMPDVPPDAASGARIASPTKIAVASSPGTPATLPRRADPTDRPLQATDSELASARPSTNRSDATSPTAAPLHGLPSNATARQSNSAVVRGADLSVESPQPTASRDHQGVAGRVVAPASPGTASTGEARVVLPSPSPSPEAARASPMSRASRTVDPITMVTSTRRDSMPMAAEPHLLASAPTMSIAAEMSRRHPRSPPQQPPVRREPAAPPAVPTVHVTIGRIELRAPATVPDAATGPARHAASPTTSLDDYLRRRDRGGAL